MSDAKYADMMSQIKKVMGVRPELVTANSQAAVSCVKTERFDVKFSEVDMRSNSNYKEDKAFEQDVMISSSHNR